MPAACIWRTETADVPHSLKQFGGKVEEKIEFAAAEEEQKLNKHLRNWRVENLLSSVERVCDKYINKYQTGFPLGPAEH